MNGTAIYAIEMAWPESGETVIRSLDSSALAGKTIVGVTLLGQAAPVAWQLQSDGMHLKVPTQAPGKHAFAFKIQWK
jgi:alpha-L-fucosidase